MHLSLFSLFFIFLYENAESTIREYYRFYILDIYNVFEYYNSVGATFRLLPSIISALILLLNKNKIYPLLSKDGLKIYERMSYLVLILIFIVIIAPEYSTAIDRFGIFLYPLTIVVLNKIIDFRFLNISRFNYHLIYISSFFIYTFVWLQIGNYKDAFVPYKNYLYL